MTLDPLFIPKLGASFWQKLYAFYYVARLQSYSRAAEHLSVSQASLSKAVQILEGRLQVELLLRNRGGVIALTEQGQVIFKQVERIIVELAFLEASLEPAQINTQSILSLQIADWLLSDYYIDPIMNFKKDRLNLNLKIHASVQAEDTAGVLFDINIRCGLEPNKAMIQKPLLNFSLGYYASAKYLQTHGEPRDLKDLAKHLLYQHAPMAIFENLQGCNNLQLSCDKTPYLSIYSSACLIKIAESEGGIIRCIKDNPVLQGHGLVPILQALPEPCRSQMIYFCCSQATWEQQDVQALYHCLKSPTKHESERVAIAYSYRE